MRTRVLCAALATLLLSAAPAAADVNVTTTGDTTAADGQCTLREALAAADAHAATADCPGVVGSGTTTIALPAGFYALTGGALPVGGTADVALVGQGADRFATEISAENADRVLTVAAGGALRLDALTVSRGAAPVGGDGGAIRSEGTLALAHVEIKDSRAGDGAAGADGGRGGAIFSSGPLTATDLTIDTVFSGGGGTGLPGANGGAGGDGGAIYSTGALTIDGADIDFVAAAEGGRGGDAAAGTGGAGGDGGAGGRGGAISADGPSVSLTGLVITKARASSGGIGGAGDTTTATPGAGGKGGDGGLGGAIVIRGGGATIARSWIDDAHAGSGGWSTGGGDGGDALGGGGIAVLGGALTLTDSTISESWAGSGGDAVGGTSGDGGSGGAIYATADLTATNVTVFHAHAGGVGGNLVGGPGAFGVPGGGGGVWSSGAGTVVLRHVTAVDDSVEPGATGATAFEGVDTVEGSIASGGAPLCANVGGGTGNVAHPSAGGCPGATVGDPRLDVELYDNGGPTPTLSPAPGSAAIDAAPAAGCPAADQRGIPRPQGAGCDAGAVEAIATPACDDLAAATPYGTPVTVTLSCTAPALAGALMYGLYDVPAHGTLEPVSERSLVYTPDDGFSGTDAFTYTALTPFTFPSTPATVTVTVGAGPTDGTPAPPGRGPRVVLRPTVTRPPRVTPVPNRPTAPPGTTRAPLLVIKAKQKGKVVKAIVNVPVAGSRLDARLTIKGRGGKAKPVVVGKATARRLPVGPYALTVRLDRRHGRAALRAHRSLKVTLRIAVTPPTGAALIRTKAITLSR